jgi:hypothetical protein
MSKMKLISAAVLVAICMMAGQGAAFAQYANNEQEIRFVAEVPLLNCDATPCIEARIGGGKSVRMVIDTGDVDTILDTKAAEAAGIKPAGPAAEGMPAGSYPAKIAALQIGELTLKDVDVTARDFTDWIAKNQMPHVAGTLAYTAFKDRILQLDFAAHQLRISDVLTGPVDCEKICAKYSLIAFGKQGPPIVVAEGFEINGKSVTAQIDTMYTGALLVYNASIDKLGLHEAAKTTATRQFAYTDGGVTMKVAPAKCESFRGVPLGDGKPKVYFPTPGVHEPDGMFDATVGLELFVGAIVTLDLHNRKVFMQRDKPQR